MLQFPLKSGTKCVKDAIKVKKKERQIIRKNLHKKDHLSFLFYLLSYRSIRVNYKYLRSWLLFNVGWQMHERLWNFPQWVLLCVSQSKMTWLFLIGENWSNSLFLWKHTPSLVPLGFIHQENKILILCICQGNHPWINFRQRIRYNNFT